MKSGTRLVPVSLLIDKEYFMTKQLTLTYNGEIYVFKDPQQIQEVEEAFDITYRFVEPRISILEVFDSGGTKLVPLLPTVPATIYKVEL